MSTFSATQLFGITIRESATNGSDFSNAPTNYRRLFLGTDGLLHLKDAAGTVTDIGTGGGSALTVKDEGTNLDTAVTSLNFTGSGVTATNVGHAVTVNVTSGSTPDAVLAAGRITASNSFR